MSLASGTWEFRTLAAISFASIGGNVRPDVRIGLAKCTKLKLRAMWGSIQSVPLSWQRRNLVEGMNFQANGTGSTETIVLARDALRSALCLRACAQHGRLSDLSVSSLSG